jgi:uncharacterized protein (DUF1015 family)
MADIAPLRGILYDPTRVDPSKVLAPPYDVIDAAERARLAALDPHNCVRLILPEPDAEGGDRYAASARTFAAWQASGVLRRDDRRAVYRYQQTFTHPDLGGREVTRSGFIAAVRLHDPAEGRILPHERTLPGPRADRLALMKATSAHFSQIFALFRDTTGDVERLFRRVEREAPAVDATLDGVRHRLWRMADAEAIGKLRHLLAPRKLYIADGHHRFETMRGLRDHLAAKAPLSPYSSAQYATMFLAPMDQGGLLILPTHRVLHGVDGLTPASLVARARAHFLVDRIPGAARDLAAMRAAVADAPEHQPAFAAVFPGEADAWRFTLEPGANALALSLAPRTTAKLDVSVLHNVLLDRVLGISPAQQEAQTHLRYARDAGAALAELARPGTQAVFLLAPSTVEQVVHVADAGDVMPQKSTYFFPKLASGLVMNQVDPDEDLR